MREISWWKTAYAVCVLCAATAVVLPAQAFRTLYSFDDTDGRFPSWALVQGTDGNFYGTTPTGGANASGTIFRITPGGTLTTIYNFCSQVNCADGAYPQAGLILAGDGNLYGTAQGGGASSFGGTIFEISTSGVLHTLYNFCPQGGDCVDGGGPSAPLLQARDGSFYGTTQFGGTAGYDGTVFRITPGGTLTTIHTFCSENNCADGYNPVAGLIQATDGDFYSTTQWGGANGFGTIFKITPGGTLTTLYSFCSIRNSSGYCADGTNSYAPLLQATDGNFYGTNWAGGTYNDGIVFSITPSGTFTTLHSFDGTDGQGLYAGLIRATDGNFYGTADNGGSGTNCSPNCGTIFRMTLDGTVTTLHNFNGAVAGEGWGPYAALAQDTDGSLYGLTQMGGTSNDACADRCGTVFELSAGLGPFVETVPTSGNVGKSVIILGTSLIRATSVTFNGTEAAFTVESPTSIKTTVPAGATTGKVQVVTPGGTLTSNVPFRVLP
jgi:uncharacterized repeat protein (TIGR03803 family)